MDPWAASRAAISARPDTRGHVDAPAPGQGNPLRRVDGGACDYLRARGLRHETLAHPRFAETWRVDRRRNAIFVHRDEAGAITGFEVKNRDYTNFAPGGTKTAWQSAAREGDGALVVTESAIDALSYHQLRRDDGDSLRYLSTAGAPSTSQIVRLEKLLAGLPPCSTAVAAVDADEAGHKLAGRIETLARRITHVGFRRDAPVGGKDWNDVLQRVERDFIRSQGLLRPTRDPSGRER
jgi:hypothetical protein